MDRNRSAWDARARKGEAHARPATAAELSRTLAEQDAHGWLAEGVAGKELLCLASGGGRQSVLYARHGARVTVVDLSPGMLELDRRAAVDHGFDVRLVQTSMDDLSMLAAASFDIVIQPVSTCYLPDVVAVYREVARVLRPGGLYISQHKQPTSMQTDVGLGPHGYAVVEPYYRSGPLPAVRGSAHREEGTFEYLHRWQELVGGLCRTGFVIEDLVEPHLARDDAAPGEFGHRSRFVPPYVRLKARRLGPLSRGPLGGSGDDSPTRRPERPPLWLPD